MPSVLQKWFKGHAPCLSLPGCWGPFSGACTKCDSPCRELPVIRHGHRLCSTHFLKGHSMPSLQEGSEGLRGSAPPLLHKGAPPQRDTRSLYPSRVGTHFMAFPSKVTRENVSRECKQVPLHPNIRDKLKPQWF